jgi:hypothetical protein
VRRTILATTLVTIIIAGASVWAAPAWAAWGPETAPFNLEAVLRPVEGSSGFGLVSFRQPNDADQIVYLDAWVRGLQPNHDYVLRRAADAPDGVCTSDAWLTLGKGPDPGPISTDATGTGRAELFRSLAAFAPGTAFDIRFVVADAATLTPVLMSGCYRFVVSL